MVYFVQCVENGLIKIGHTAKPIAWRMRQIANTDRDKPISLQLLGLISGGLAEERAVHRRFSKYRAEDWFYPFGRECFLPRIALLAAIDSFPKTPEYGLAVAAIPRQRASIRSRRPHDSVSAIGLRIRAFRRAAGLSARGLSLAAGLSHAWLNHVELGRISKPAAERVLAIAKALNVKNDVLVGAGEVA
jgi:hypothetical protein